MFQPTRAQQGWESKDSSYPTQVSLESQWNLRTLDWPQGTVVDPVKVLEGWFLHPVRSTVQLKEQSEPLVDAVTLQVNLQPEHASEHPGWTTS